MSGSITTVVEVAVAPEAAFDAFTREIDAWYRVDTDTLPDITRTAAIRFEPRMGGRLLDVHDLATGAGRELGRITCWEPGRRLAFTDNEGTEVEVRFEARGAGTRVTLTHRGLDRLAPQRAKQLRRSGWAELAPFYRGHIAPNARPAALAVAFQALLVGVLAGVIGLTTMLAGGRLPAWAMAIVTTALVLAVGFGVLGTQDRLARRWVSSWQHQRMSLAVLGLGCLGLLIEILYRVFEHGADALGAVWVPVFVLLTIWSCVEQGPAGGRSLRRPVRTAEEARTRRHTIARSSRIVAGAALGAGLLVALDSTGALAGAVAPTMQVLVLVLALYSLVSRRRQKHDFGFHPGLYLAVDRPMSEGKGPPALLFHRPSAQPEYSGWYAYASEQDRHSGDLVAWSMKDLVDHSPETAGPLREGHGDWQWDRAQRAYRRVDR